MLSTLMSSLFQGLADVNGVLTFTTDAAGTVPFRGMLVTPAGAIFAAADMGQPRVLHSGRAFDAVTGAILLDPGVITPVLGMGGMTVDRDGGLITKDQAADVIHQGVGLTVEGYLVGQGAGVQPVFYAPLVSDTADQFSAVDTFARGSDGTYLSGGLWDVAGANVARFEDGRLLMEPAETNINTNWNANPDVALVNINPGAATLTRVSDPTIIAQAGLQNIATEGNVVDLNNTSGGTVNALIGGQLPITTDYYVDIWAKPFSTIVDIKLGSTSTRVPQNESFNRVPFLAPNAGATTFLTIVLRNNTRCRFLLNNTYQGTYLVNPIITQGASASRAIDQLSWANADSFFNQTEGMAIVTYTPKYNLATLPTAAQLLVSLSSNGRLIYTGADEVRVFDGTNFAQLTLPSFSPEQELKFASLWGPGGLQVGYKYSGSWVWSAVVPYAGAFGSDNVLSLGGSVSVPARFNDLYIYKDNEGTGWIEGNH